MIEKSELERVAAVKRLGLKQAEKDYLLEILLYILCEKKDLIFKGGTALYKLFSLNRFSEDLDFTLVGNKIKIQELCQKILSKLKKINIEGRIKEIGDSKNQKNITLELRGPLFDGNRLNLSVVRINISLKEKLIYKPEQRMIFSKYTEIPSFDVFVMKQEELLSEKIRALLTRDKARDVYDVWFLLMKGAGINLRDLNKKLKLYNEKFDINKFKKKIEEKRNDWERDLKALIIGGLPDFEIVKSQIIGRMVKRN